MATIETPAGAAQTMVLNMGPQHPSTHGVLRIVLELDGEIVLKARAHIGYLHTGIEKNCENKTYSQAITLTDRLDYLAPLSNNLCYCLAVERLIGLEIPKRAQYIRVLLTELTRVASHLVWLGTHAIDLGAMTVFLYCFREREEIMRIFEMVSGQRMMTSYFRIGGLALEPPPGYLERIGRSMETFPAHVDEYETLLTHNRIWLARTQVRPPNPRGRDRPRRFGPALRASGVAYDVRKMFPYSSYEEFDFNVPTKPPAIATRVIKSASPRSAKASKLSCKPRKRFHRARSTEVPGIVPPSREEMKTSIEGLIYHFKIFTEGFALPRGEVYQCIESPRGELGFYVASNGSPKPYRVKVRAPSFVNLQACPSWSKDD